METTRLSSKGQVIIPKPIRDTRGWSPGLALSVEETEEGILLRPLSSYPKTSVADLLGCAGYKGPRKSLDEMQAAISKGAKSRR